MLTLVMALGVADAIREQTGLDARIKWPNDVVLNGKKIWDIRGVRLPIVNDSLPGPDGLHHAFYLCL